MGRRKPHIRKKQNGGENLGKIPRKAYEDIVKENEKFIKYYQSQKICKEDEWNDFITAIKSDLPATFRITGSKEVAKKMLEIVKGELIEECLHQTEGGDTSIAPLPWYPDNLAWQLTLTRKDIRRSEAYFKLHNFLITETENGTISRQETVSMIPPLLLDIKSHHKVLDMCAAPGSKTAQIIEMLHGDTDVTLPTGYVVANDIDNKRCYMLVHQAKRLNSPCMAVINHDSAILPNLVEDDGNGGTKQVLYDRVLCDVPCSGDGTLRKNPDIWMKWTPANCLHQHIVQSRILKRGIELVAVGGRVVYSTCSLNPIENEAVIHHILAESNGAVELVDVNDILPELKHSPGLDHWLVGNKYLEFFNTFEEVEQKWRTVIRPQMFPPKIEDRERYHLNRCIRILPHQQNTGAFFVAVLQKIKPLGKQMPTSEVVEPDSVSTSETDKISESQSTTIKREHEDVFARGYRKKRRFEGYKEDPFVFFKEGETVWEDIKSYYEISDNFDSKCLLTRCLGGKKKNIYFTSPAVKDLVLHNQQSVKFINTGIRTFVRSDNRNMKCAFRLAQEGLESIIPFIGGHRKINIPKDDLITLLLNDSPDKPPIISTLSEMVQKQVETLSPGSCILIYTEENGKGDKPLVLYVSGWRGTQSLRCYTSLPSTVHFLRILKGDISKYIVNKFQKSDEEENGPSTSTKTQAVNAKSE
ncbi:hypothetical protein RN001_001163 [Aquatica leii]|uniref:tRNA (cytosine(34)-C(5))-methyltransferase n=1 Tax=Aquatica leii TaxID=1421715 RepID=A0AAN7PFS5_9COLE|nr:hypothetical protein RN001_001163 [Aquatica leii]